MRVSKEKNIKKSLVEQLNAKGADIAIFEDLIDDYMSLWKIKNLLVKDIKKRGVVYEDVSSTGIKMQKNNPSVKEVVAINKQMLQTLEKLAINTKSAVGGASHNEENL